MSDAGDGDEEDCPGPSAQFLAALRIARVHRADESPTPPEGSKGVWSEPRDDPPRSPGPVRAAEPEQEGTRRRASDPSPRSPGLRVDPSGKEPRGGGSSVSTEPDSNA